MTRRIDQQHKKEYALERHLHLRIVRPIAARGNQGNAMKLPRFPHNCPICRYVGHIEGLDLYYHIMVTRGSRVEVRFEARWGAHEKDVFIEYDMPTLTTDRHLRNATIQRLSEYISAALEAAVEGRTTISRRSRKCPKGERAG